MTMRGGRAYGRSPRLPPNTESTLRQRKRAKRLLGWSAHHPSLAGSATGDGGASAARATAGGLGGWSGFGLGVLTAVSWRQPAVGGHGGGNRQPDGGDPRLGGAPRPARAGGSARAGSGAADSSSCVYG